MKYTRNLQASEPHHPNPYEELGVLLVAAASNNAKFRPRFA